MKETIPADEVSYDITSKHCQLCEKVFEKLVHKYLVFDKIMCYECTVFMEENFDDYLEYLKDERAS